MEIVMPAWISHLTKENIPHLSNPKTGHLPDAQAANLCYDPP